MSNIHIYNLVYVYSSMSHTFIRLSNPFPPSDGPDVPKLECRHPKCPHFRQRHQLFVCWGWWSWHCWDNLILVISMFITSSLSSQTHPLLNGRIPLESLRRNLAWKSPNKIQQTAASQKPSKSFPPQMSPEKFSHWTVFSKQKRSVKS